MPRIPILKLGSTGEVPPPKLASYSPVFPLAGLQLGIDNLRHDVRLSPMVCEAAANHIRRLIAKHGNVENVLAADAVNGAGSRGAMAKFLPVATRKGDLKPLLLELHKSALNQAKAENNIAIDLLARTAVLKFLRLELNSEFMVLVERCRSTLKGYEGVRQQKALEYRETVAAFQIAKKNILRQTGQDLLRMLFEIEKENLSTTRRSLFGNPAADYQIFLNRLCFMEENRDSHLAAEHYVLIGGFDNDPDSFGNVRAVACEFLRAAASPVEHCDDAVLDGWLNTPENAHEMVGNGEGPDEAHLHRVKLWVELLERENLMELVLAAYAIVPHVSQYTPHLDPQQLKYALVSRKERDRVEKLIEEHGKLSMKPLLAAASKVDQLNSGKRAKVAARFLADFMRYHRDLRRLETLNRAAEKINLITSEKLGELSRLNGTLYYFSLASESIAGEEKPVCRHVILKADVRDSSRLTKSLLERDLNPASYFGLNFYDPVNKLLSKYGASKVFVEGDAIILALLEREGEPPLAVARMCVLAREMMEIVGGYNHLLQRAGLPALELGIGISFQDSAPMYLLDGDHRIMISDALNESDRLSSCDKRMRLTVGSMQAPFNIYEFRAEKQDSEPMRYNVGGIRMSAAAFSRLRQEITLAACPLSFPKLWGSETSEFYTGLVPVGSDIFRKIVVRASCIPVIEGADYSLRQWTNFLLYEVCTNPAVYAEIERASKAGK